MTPAAKPSEAATTLGVAIRTQNTTLAPTDDAAPAPITCSGQPVSNGSHASGSEATSACARHCGGCCLSGGCRPCWGAVGGSFAPAHRSPCPTPVPHRPMRPSACAERWRASCDLGRPRTGFAGQESELDWLPDCSGRSKQTNKPAGCSCGGFFWHARSVCRPSSPNPCPCPIAECRKCRAQRKMAPPG